MEIIINGVKVDLVTLAKECECSVSELSACDILDKVGEILVEEMGYNGNLTVTANPY